MKVFNRHTAAVEGVEPGQTGDVDEARAQLFLRAGYLVPANPGDVRLGADDPTPSREAIERLTVDHAARGHAIEGLSRDLEREQTKTRAQAERAEVLQQQVNELQALAAQRARLPATADGGQLALELEEAKARIATLTTDLEAATAPKPSVTPAKPATPKG